jgi:hypothetical protein
MTGTTFIMDKIGVGCVFSGILVLMHSRLYENNLNNSLSKGSMVTLLLLPYIIAFDLEYLFQWSPPAQSSPTNISHYAMRKFQALCSGNL